MAIFNELFTSTEGLMSLGVIVFMLVMAAFIGKMAISKMKQEEKQRKTK